MFLTKLAEAVKGIGNVSRPERTVAGLYLDVEMSVRICDFDVFVVFNDYARPIDSAKGQETGDAVKVLIEKATMDSADPGSLYRVKGRGEFLKLVFLFVVADIQWTILHAAMLRRLVGGGERGAATIADSTAKCIMCRGGDTRLLARAFSVIQARPR